MTPDFIQDQVWQTIKPIAIPVLLGLGVIALFFAAIIWKNFNEIFNFLFRRKTRDKPISERRSSNDGLMIEFLKISERTANYLSEINALVTTLRDLERDEKEWQNRLEVKQDRFEHKIDRIISNQA